MRPASAELLRVVARTLEEVVAPALAGGRERNTTVCAALLLEHVATRIDLERTLLVDDNRDKRATLRRIVRTLRARHPRNPA